MLQVKTESDIYDDVDEATYQEMVKKSREESFIVDDDGNDGYDDNGQEDWDDAGYSGDEAEQMAKRAKGVATRSKGVFHTAPKAKTKVTERVSAMFLIAGHKVIGDVKPKVTSPTILQ